MTSRKRMFKVIDYPKLAMNLFGSLQSCPVLTDFEKSELKLVANTAYMHTSETFYHQLCELIDTLSEEAQLWIEMQ